MKNANLRNIMRDYANLVNAGVRREALSVGVLASLVWLISSVGVFSVIAGKDYSQTNTSFAKELKSTVSQYGNTALIVAFVLLGMAVGSGEFKYAESRQEAKRMAKYIIKSSCKNVDSSQLTYVADRVLAAMSNTERKRVLDMGIALRDEVDKYVVKAMAMRITRSQQRRLIYTAMIKYKDEVVKMIEHNQLIAFMSAQSYLPNNPFVAFNAKGK